MSKDYILSLDVVVYGEEDGRLRAINVPDVLFTAHRSDSRSAAWVDGAEYVTLEIGPEALRPLPGLDAQFFTVERNGFVVGSGSVRVNADGIVCTCPALISLSAVSVAVLDGRRSA